MFDWLYWIFGKILTGVDLLVFHTLGIHNAGICIILFTLVVYLLMFPLNAKQQKSTRLMNKIQPEMKEIQKKYKGKTDQASQLKMNEETQALYAKYGISPFGGCLPLLVSLPVMLCLYRVIYSLGTYVPALDTSEAKMFLNMDISWTPLQTFNNGVHSLRFFVFLVPILAMVLQFINTKVMQAGSNVNTNQDDNPMGQSMKMMNYFMPIMSGFFCLSLNIGIGIYWIVGSLFRIVQAIVINKQIDKIDMDTLIEQNKEKAAKKAKKLEERNEQMAQYAKTRTSSIRSVSSYKNENKTSDDSSSTTTSNKNFKKGSIADIAHMNVSDKKKD
ncbi:MAG: YidC/Oxa1 family membrane protein insertase [Eubacterium sp.]|nr:YidC/Oxa1 family membrane protein insertase [Eubacterium sp.]